MKKLPTNDEVAAMAEDEMIISLIEIRDELIRVLKLIEDEKAKK